MKKLNTNEIISKNRRKYYLKIHLVLVVKYRKQLLNNNSLLKTNFYKEKTLWSDGYFVSSVGYLDENTVKEYIKNQ